MTRESAGIAVLTTTLTTAMILLILGAPAIAGGYLTAGVILSLGLLRWG